MSLLLWQGTEADSGENDRKAGARTRAGLELAEVRVVAVTVAAATALSRLVTISGSSSIAFSSRGLARAPGVVVGRGSTPATVVVGSLYGSVSPQLLPSFRVI